jgi:hypothetical protein
MRDYGDEAVTRRDGITRDGGPMIFDLTSFDLAEMRRLMQAGAHTPEERELADLIPTTVARALGERDQIGKELEAWKDAFDHYTKAVDRILSDNASARVAKAKQ